MHVKALVTALGAAVCVSAQGNVTAGNGSLTSLIANTNSLSQLGSLLGVYPSVAATLASVSGVTLFAPNNAAIKAAIASLGNVTAAEVAALLSYHVVDGELLSTAFTETPLFPATLLNDNAYSTVVGGQVVELALMGSDATVTSGLKSVSTVVTPDLMYSGGIVHIIDKVLTIPPPVSAVLGPADLTSLLGAVIATNLTAALDTASEITIFAPSNAAFAAIGSAAANLTTLQLTRVLEYHVVVGHAAYSSDIVSGSLPTLLGRNVNVEVLDGAVFVNGARVINSDILISGGVMHVIDSVLNPLNTTAMPPNSTVGVPQYPSVSSAALPAALTSMLPSTSSFYSALTATTLSVAAGYSSANVSSSSAMA